MNKNTAKPEPETDKQPSTSEGFSASDCSAYRFVFCATDAKKIPITHLEGGLTVEQVSDLPHAALAVFQGIVADWDLGGMEEMTLSIHRNEQPCAPAQKTCDDCEGSGWADRYSGNLMECTPCGGSGIISLPNAPITDGKLK